jgi:biotin carboxylase
VKDANRLLIFGGSHSELPLIQAARSMGLSVVTSGNRPDHPGHALSDQYIQADFSDSNAMIEVAQSANCSFVLSAANDFAYLSACEVAEKLNLPGYDSVEVARILHHKHAFKPLAESIGMPVTRFKIVDADKVTPDDLKSLQYPLMVKAVDLTGGKGISVIDSADQLPMAIQYARSQSKQQSLVIEEYFKGSLHSYSTIICDGKVVFDYADNEFCHPTPYLVSTSTSIVSVPLHIFEHLKVQTERLAQKLGLVDGVLHCQFLYGDGDYVILEYTRRCSGDLYSSVVELVTGLAHAEQFVRQALNLPTQLRFTKPVSPFVSRHCVFPSVAGKFGGIRVSEKITGRVASITEAFGRDYHFDEPNKEKSGVVILAFDSHQSMLNDVPALQALCQCTVHPN